MEEISSLARLLSLNRFEQASLDNGGLYITEELIRIERSLWTNNADVYQKGYLPEAVLIFPIVGRIGRDAAVAAIREENALGRHWAEVRFEEVSTLSLGTEAVLLTYRAFARWNYEQTSGETLCGTVYVRREDGWKVALHQQTVVNYAALTV